MFVPSEVPQACSCCMRMHASCVSMRSQTEDCFKKKHCAMSLRHINSFSSVWRLNDFCLLVLTYHSPAKQPASCKLKCFVRPHSPALLDTAHSDNQAYQQSNLSWLAFLTVDTLTVYCLLHPLHQNHCLIKIIKMQIASENLHVQSCHGSKDWQICRSDLTKDTKPSCRYSHIILHTTHQTIRKTSCVCNSMVMLLLPCHVDKRSQMTEKR